MALISKKKVLAISLLSCLVVGTATGVVVWFVTKDRTTTSLQKYIKSDTGSHDLSKNSETNLTCYEYENSSPIATKWTADFPTDFPLRDYIHFFMHDGSTVYDGNAVSTICLKLENPTDFYWEDTSNFKILSDWGGVDFDVQIPPNSDDQTIPTFNHYNDIMREGDGQYLSAFVIIAGVHHYADIKVEGPGEPVTWEFSTNHYLKYKVMSIRDIQLTATATYNGVTSQPILINLIYSAVPMFDPYMSYMTTGDKSQILKAYVTIGGQKIYTSEISIDGLHKGRNWDWNPQTDTLTYLETSDADIVLTAIATYNKKDSEPIEITLVRDGTPKFDTYLGLMHEGKDQILTAYVTIDGSKRAAQIAVTGLNNENWTWEQGTGKLTYVKMSAADIRLTAIATYNGVSSQPIYITLVYDAIPIIDSYQPSMLESDDQTLTAHVAIGGNEIPAQIAVTGLNNENWSWESDTGKLTYLKMDTKNMFNK